MWGEGGNTKFNKIVKLYEKWYGKYSRENFQNMIKYYRLFYYVLEE